MISTFESLYQRAAQEHVTAIASSGDTGSTNADLNFDLYPYPAVGYPASSPWVTAVGGTSLYADDQGNYQYETVWGEPVGPFGYCGAGGGGVSQVFGQPAYQRTLPRTIQGTLAGHRGMPDVSWIADPCQGILIYLSFLPDAGWYFIGGTSEGAPQWAGVVADLDELTHHSLGFMNPLLYTLAPLPFGGFHDVTIGSNADLDTTVPGYDARSGWDLATGFGSPDVKRLARLIQLASRG